MINFSMENYEKVRVKMENGLNRQGIRVLVRRKAERRIKVNVSKYYKQEPKLV